MIVVPGNIYIHPPRQPNHIIPSKEGDQLCHGVVKSRLLKPMVASQYCNIYQMHEQRGSFQGIDTCDVCSFGDFGHASILLDETESRSIKYRSDINALLNNLVTENVMTKETAESFRRRARDNAPSDDIMGKYQHGATYVDLEDALLMQYEIGSEKCINIYSDEMNSRNTEIIQTK